VIYDVVFSRAAEQDFGRLSAGDQRRIDNALMQFATGETGDVRRLTEHGDELRLRVGGLRIRFLIDHQAGSITVTRILPRGRAYRD
jgi:mRNA-degrading endonuclease RelE of RelBE toxin-antitoxin system